jgi:hypothetical protein
MAMNEQTAKLIQQLADKLGTTAEHLWAVLIKQAPITSSIELAGFVIALAIAGYLTKLFRGYCKANPRDLDEPHVCFGWFGIILFLAIWTIAFIMHMPVVLAGFTNPEYWALMQVMPGH